MLMPMLMESVVKEVGSKITLDQLLNLTEPVTAVCKVDAQLVCLMR